MRLRTAIVLLASTLGACSGADSATSSGRAGVVIGASPQRGPSDAWVTIVEFSDFECPYCGAEEPILQQVLGANPNDVRLVYKHFTLAQHPYARGAAIAAECAGDQGKFWEMHDELFAHQDVLDATHLPGYAQAAGVPDLTTWQACLGTPAPAARVDADLTVAAQLGLPATPTLIVNGDEYVGALSYAQLAQVVATALQDAEKSGIPRSEYYQKAVLGQ
jgi:protein-disulfide isomerase